jgi:hypothetical protein
MKQLRLKMRLKIHGTKYALVSRPNCWRAFKMWCNGWQYHRTMINEKVMIKYYGG